MNDQPQEAWGTGYRTVQSRTSCVLTRFQVRSGFAILRFFRAFRRIRQDASTIDGHIVSLFIVENRHTCYTLSLWRDPEAILAFNSSVVSHIRAANACFRDLQFGANGAKLWSAEFSLSAVSPHNLRWDGFPATPRAAAPVSQASLD